MNYNVDAPNYNVGASPAHATTIATTIAATISATIAATIAAQKFFRVVLSAFTRNLQCVYTADCARRQETCGGTPLEKQLSSLENSSLCEFFFAATIVATIAATIVAQTECFEWHPARLRVISKVLTRRVVCFGRRRPEVHSLCLNGPCGFRGM